MKALLFFISVVIVSQVLTAQSVGIGTTTPHTKAALEISSTTKGLLIPSMTSGQRNAITSPPNGLMVYDTDVNQLYHHDGTAWRKMLNSTYWNQSSTRNWVYTSTDSVGIGTSIPAERLDVNGNIRSRNNIIAENNIAATGSITGSLLSSTGNLVAVGTSLLNGDVTTNSDLIINNTTATLQLRSSNVNKGFFQLSGDNVRMGTNSGNTTGNLIIRMNGTDRVFVDEDGNVGINDPNPTSRLDVNGNINLTGELNRTAQTGTASLTPLCYGLVSNTGTI